MRFVSKITKLAILMAVFAVLFTSCQKEDKLDVATQANTKTTYVDYNKSYNVEKGGTITKPGTVYVIQGDGSYTAHRTIKIRTLNWSYCQEWLLDNLNTDYYGQIDPTYNPILPYEPWAKAIQLSIDANEWDNGILCSDASGDPLKFVTGFHIPRINPDNQTTSDIDRLGAALGSNSLIRSKLQLTYGGCRFWNPAFSPSQANLWVEVRGESIASNLVAGCGCVGCWNLPNDNFGLYFTNIPQTETLVRVVRNITQAQW